MFVGLILAAIVAAGLAYVMIGLKRSGDIDAMGLDATAAISDLVVVVRTGGEDDETPADPTQVSTPLLRRAARQEMARAAQAAVRRRRWGLVAAVAAVAGVVVSVMLVPGLSLRWALLAPAPLLMWIALARLSVVVTHARWRVRLDEVEYGWDEETTLIDLGDDAAAQPARSEMSIELSVPLASIPSLLEPLPVAPATYVSRPVLPRSVHTIDLSAPDPQASPMFPISADMPQDVLPFDQGGEAGAGPDEASDDLPDAI
jgi:hypothetical protein